ncbi:ISAs1 family transposase [Myxococcus xanthus]|nr:ISAs1 family transposase [Myxococcus xanthus]
MAARRALPSSGVQQVAVDGKSLRGGTYGLVERADAPCSHYLVEGRDSLLVGLAPAPGGASSEAAVAADLLSLLELTDTVVTGDANLLTGVLADGIVNAGGGYVLALKGNRGPVHAAVCEMLCVVGGKDVLDEARAESLCDSRTDSGEEAGHGRKEQRRGWAFDVKHFPRVQHYLPHARSVLALVRERSVVTLNGTETSREQHFFVSTREPSDAEAMATFVRAHWEVENGLHQRLDVVLHEDATRIHNGPGAQNLAVVRRAALSVLKADSSFKASLPRRVRQAGGVAPVKSDSSGL